MSTLMLHHLPRRVREQCVQEMRRVLKPGGRVLAVDFANPVFSTTRCGLLKLIPWRIELISYPAESYAACPVWHRRNG